MSRKSAKGPKHNERSISARAIRRNPPDLRRLASALVAFAIAQAEADAAAEHERAAAPELPPADTPSLKEVV